MKIVVLGISGLIGSHIFKEFSKNFNTIGTLRKSIGNYKGVSLFKNDNVIDNVDVLNFENLSNILIKAKPYYIINCVGITKRKINNNISKAIEVNSVFPHKLADWAIKNNSRLIHFSTDCVYNGFEGNYNEKSPTNALDIYGKTKALGEIDYKNCLTIRSSFIGTELFDKTELLEWVLSNNRKKIKGFKKTMYSGVSTLFLTKFIMRIVSERIQINGLYNLAPKIPISKYDLICLIKKEFNLNLEIEPENETIHNPTLDGSKLRSIVDIQIPSWDIMLKNLSLYKI